MAPMATMLRSGTSASMKASSTLRNTIPRTRTLFATNENVASTSASTSEASVNQASNTVFYAGKSYTEAEWTKALQDGPVAKPATSVPKSTIATPRPEFPSFGSVMAFNGTAPEIVNGRLAMLGFVAALGAELASGETVFKQLREEPTGIVLTFFLFIVGSLIPKFNGNKGDQVGPFTPQAEMLNGRAAMIGFASLIAIEVAKGSALF